MAEGALLPAGTMADPVLLLPPLLVGLRVLQRGTVSPWLWRLSRVAAGGGEGREAILNGLGHPAESSLLLKQGFRRRRRQPIFPPWPPPSPKFDARSCVWMCWRLISVAWVDRSIDA